MFSFLQVPEEIMSADQQTNWSFSGIANGYEKYLAPMLSLWTGELFEKAALQAGDRVLDVACGTGIVARMAADVVGTDGAITGLDVDAEMLAVARSSTTAEGVSVSWIQGDAAELPFDDQSFNRVFCQQGLQFIGEPATALREMYRVLEQGGRVALSVWGPVDRSPGYQALGEALDKHLGEPQARANAAVFAMGEADPLRKLLDEAGFADINIETSTRQVQFPSPREFFRREVVSWLAAAFEEPAEQKRRAVVNELDQRLEPYVDERGLTFPMEALIACGQKR